MLDCLIKLTSTVLIFYSGITPLMMAIKKENVWMTKYFMAKNAATDVQDGNQNTIYHYAANTNKELIELVCEQLEEKRTSAKYCKGGDEPDSARLESPSVKILNEPNHEGNTPLHIACLNDKPECVHALL